MNDEKLAVIAEAKSAFRVTTDKKQAHEACWLLYGSFYRLFCHLDATEGPLNLGWGERYPRDLLAITQVVAVQAAGKPLRQLSDFRDEFNGLSIRIPADQSRPLVALHDIRNFGGLLLDGHELITKDAAASEFVVAKSMDEDLDEALTHAHRTLVQRQQT